MSSEDIKGVADSKAGTLLVEEIPEGRYRASYRCKGAMAAVIVGFGETKAEALLALAQGLVSGMVGTLGRESAAPSAATVLHLAKAWEAML